MQYCVVQCTEQKCDASLFLSKALCMANLWMRLDTFRKILRGQDGLWEAVSLSMQQLLPFKSLPL